MFKRWRDRRETQQAVAWQRAHYYGGIGTIHRTGRLDIEIGPLDEVVAVWFRCRQLPFRVSRASEERAASIRVRPNEMDALGRIDGLTIVMPGDPDY